MKSNKKNYYMAIFIILIMVSSTLGFIIGSSNDSNSNSNNQKGLNYVNGWWIISKNGFDYRFRYLPDENFNYKEIILNDQISLYSEVIGEEQLSRLSYFFAANSISYSKIDNYSCSSDTNVLILKIGLDKTYKDGNCLVLEGDIDRSIDKIGYSLVL